MIWLYNKKLDDNNILNFYQVFVENNIVFNDNNKNLIYSFDSSNFENSKLSFNLNDYESNDIECDIKIIEQMISYDILSSSFNNNKNYVFSTKSSFIEPNDNEYNLPIFSYSYKLTNTKKFPNLIESEYDSVLNLNLKIYKLDNENNVQFIIETNLYNNTIRKYFVLTNLNLLKPFIKLK